MEILTETPVIITDSARIQLEKIKLEQQIPDLHGLRVGVKGADVPGSVMFLVLILRKQMIRST